jgi:hypothetical protein
LLQVSWVVFGVHSPIAELSGRVESSGLSGSRLIASQDIPIEPVNRTRGQRRACSVPSGQATMIMHTLQRHGGGQSSIRLTDLAR